MRRPRTSAPHSNGGTADRSDSRNGAAGRSKVGSFLTRDVQSFFAREVWSRELATLPTFRRVGYGIARVAHLTVTNFVKDRCSWRASALTYMTVLSLVPLLALAFSVAKGMGAYTKLRSEAIDPFLESTFGGRGEVDEALAEAAREVELQETRETLREAVGIESEPLTEVLGEAAREKVGETVEKVADKVREVRDETAAGADGGAEPSSDTDSAPPGADLITEGQGAVAAADGVDESASVAVDAVQDAAPEGGAQVRAAFEMVLEFVEKTNVSSLGVFGFLIVIFTVIKLLGSIETSFNDIWGVRKARSIPRKVADYFSTIVLVPVLLVTGTGVLSIARSERFGEMLGLDGEGFAVKFLSYAVVWLGFALTYVIMPNTRTRVRSALVGGVVGGTGWLIFQWAHVELQAGVANYNAIYSTFAALPIFLFWVQFSWMTVLFGAETAAAHQNQARHGQLVRSREYDLAQKEVVALRLVTRLTESFSSGGGRRSVEALADELACPERVLEEVAGALEEAGILATVDLDDDEHGLLLARDPGMVRIQDVLDGLKGPSKIVGDSGLGTDLDPTDRAVERAFDRFRAERDRAEANLTLRELTGS